MEEYNEALKTINEIMYDSEGKRVNYIDISFSMTEGDIGAAEFIKAVETIINNSVPNHQLKKVLENDSFEVNTREYGNVEVVNTEYIYDLMQDNQ